MRVLAIDTATEACGVAVVVDDLVELELALAHGRTHARFLMPAVESALSLAGISLADIDGFVVAQGPGSFTGLRIGISTAKGFALATGKPLAGVSSLEVLAHQVMAGAGMICPIIDARRKQVYWSLYRSDGTALVAEAPETVGPVGDILRSAKEACLCVGNGALLYQKRLREAPGGNFTVAAETQHALRAGVLGKIGCRNLKAGSGNDLHSFAPVYIRKSDAEIN